MRIINKIGIKVEEYRLNTGASKTWIAKQMGYKSVQAFDGALMSKNPTIETLELFAHFLNCKVEDLYECIF